MDLFIKFIKCVCQSVIQLQYTLKSLETAKTEKIDNFCAYFKLAKLTHYVMFSEFFYRNETKGIFLYLLELCRKIYCRINV